MIAFKILRAGGVGPFSLVRWPLPEGDRPGAWVGSATGAPATCRAGVHACAIEHLPFWLGEELWRVELRGPVAESGPKLVASEGRLLSRVEAWNRETAGGFAAAAAERIREYGVAGYVEDASVFCSPEAAERDPFRTAAVSTVLAVEAARAAGGSDAVVAERALQSAWLADELRLTPGPAR